MKIKTIFYLALPVLLTGSALSQGPLDPPSGAPVPEMRTLQEIWEALDAVATETDGLQERTTALAGNLTRTAGSSLRATGAAEDTRVILQRIAEDLGRGPDWILRTVESFEETGRNPSLVVQADGTPAIAYRDGTIADSRAAWSSLSQGVWNLEFIDTSGDVTGAHTSAILAPSTVPMVAYYNSTDTSLMFAERLPGGWSTETVDAVGNSGLFCSLAHSRGFFQRPSIAYYSDRNGGSLMFTRRVLQLIPGGGTTLVWDIPEVVDDSGGVGTYASHAYVDGDTPAVAYHDSTNGDLKYARREPDGTWTISVVDGANGDVGDYCALAVRPDGRPLIIYQDLTPVVFGLKMAEWDGSEWQFSIVRDGVLAGSQIGLALNDRGEPIICWSVFDSAVNYGERISGEWLFGTAGTDSQSPDIGFLPNGRPILAWHDTDVRDLIYAELRSYRFR